MSYVDINTPVISQITLPSGNTYYIKDAEIREVVDAISQTIAGGVSFIIAWDGTSAPTVSQVPAGVVIVYNGQTYTGTMPASSATPGAFYLVKSSTQTSEGLLDIYDEYVPVGPDGSKTWEKIGDTSIDLKDVVTNVTLSKSTDTAIGTDATFTVTQPTVALATGATAGAGVISVATGITSVTDPSTTLSAESSTATGRAEFVQSVTKTKAKATATGGNTAWNNKDQVTALTGLGTASTSNAIGKDATFTITQPTVALSTGATAGTGVISVATGITSITDPTVALSSNAATATGRVQVATGSATSSSTNTDWLKGVSVSNETLTIGAATPSTTYLGASASGTGVTPTTTNIKATASGANTAWNDQKTVAAVTGYASPTTDTVIGTDSTFTITQPTVTLSTASTGDIDVVTGGTTKYLAAATSGTAVTPTTTNIKATASGANTAWNNKDSVTVLTSSTDITVTKGK